MRTVPSSLLLLAGLTFLLGPTGAGGAEQAGEVAPGPGDGPRHRVFLLTMDQGDEVWERFGHNALLIRDRATGEELVWNWGLFDFAQVDFIPRFLQGTMHYSMGPSRLEPFLRAYRAANRTVYSNEIRLTPEEGAALDAFVRWNYLPENREYTYHYFLDNCSTRIRDALDRVLGGLLRETFHDRPTPYTYRWHTRRLVQETLWIDQGLSLLLGTRGDRPITEWEAMFLPVELMELLEGMERRTADGAPGPLLGPREVLFQADRDPAPEAPPGFSAWWVALGLGLGAGLLWAGRGTLRGRTAERTALVAGTGAWGLFSGALGLLLFLALFTDHDFIHRNLNLFHLSPLALLVAGAGVPALARPAWTARGAGTVAAGAATLLAALSLAGALLQLAGILHQGNGEVVAVALPVNVALAGALLGVWRSARAGPPTPSPDG